MASYAGAAKNPGLVLQPRRTPSRVSIEFGGRTESVVAERFTAGTGSAWRQIIAASQRFADYQDKTDRTLPVIRLTSR